MIGNIVVAVIIIVAVLYLLKVLLRSFKKGGCSCGSCSSKSSCATAKFRDKKE